MSTRPGRHNSDPEIVLPGLQNRATQNLSWGVGVVKPTCIAFGVTLFGIANVVATGATAADLTYSPPPPEQIFAPAAAYNWTGFHFGSDIAWGLADATARYKGGNFSGMSLDGVTFGGAGALGGVHSGYDIQTGVLVYGIEADAALGGIEGSGTDGGNEPTLNSKVTWLATVRGRVGYAFNRFLVYATGGVAFAGNTLTVTDGASHASDRQTHVGWTVGGGVEYAIDDNWSAGLEYKYVDLGRRTYADPTVIGGTANVRLTLHTLMARLSYHF